MIPAKYWSPTKKLMLLGAMAGGKAVEDTATGNPMTFLTDLAKPLKSLSIPFTPQQTGSGDPSPSNIRPIVPWDGLTVWNGGKNLLDKHALATAPYGTFDGFGFKHKLDIQVKPNTDYTLSSSSVGALNVLYFNGTNSGQVGVNASNPRTQNSGSTGILSILLYDRENIADYENELIDIQLEEGQTATAYEPYAPTETDITFPSPVYGGTLDAVTGVLMNGWKVETLDDANAWTQGAYISYSNHDFSDRKKGSSWLGLCSAFPIKEGVASGTAFARWGGADAGNFIISPNGSGLTLEDVKTLSGQGKIVLAYPIATPQEIQLTPSQITALVGNNTIWSDADGSMTAVYLKKG